MNREIVIVEEKESGRRLDRILKDRFEGKNSRSYFQTLIEDHHVLLNGKPVKKRTIPKVGDRIEITFVAPEMTDLVPEAIPLDILYEDDHLLVINKEAGMVVHPAVGNWSGTFANALVHHCEAVQEIDGESLRPGIVHRLDKETSGLLVAAKTKKAQVALVEAFKERKVQKEYLAVCLGNPGIGVIQRPIGRHPTNRKQMAVRDDNGKSAETLFQTISFDGEISFVRLIPKSGRTHQLRVHMKFRGTPILGDSLYGKPSANQKFGALRQYLHAYKLSFLHPVTKEPLQFTAPLPKDMQPYSEDLNGACEPLLHD